MERQLQVIERNPRWNWVFGFRFGLTAILAVIILLVAFITLRSGRPEPEFNGTPISAWLSQLSAYDGNGVVAADLAVRGIGPPAIPYLLKALGTSSPVRDAYHAIWGALPFQLRRHLPGLIGSESLRAAGARGLGDLGDCVRAAAKDRDIEVSAPAKRLFNSASWPEHGTESSAH